MRHFPRGQMSVANAMRARGLSRGLGVAPHGFDMRATVFAPATRRLGGLSGNGILAPAAPGVGPMIGSYAPSIQQALPFGPATVQPSPLVTSTISPSGSSRGWTPPSGPFVAGGISTASDRIAEAQRGQEPSAPPGDPLAPAPPVRINGPIDYGDDTYTAGPIAPPNGRPGARLPFGWPWYVWVAVVVGGGIGVYALTAR